MVCDANGIFAALGMTGKEQKHDGTVAAYDTRMLYDIVTAVEDAEIDPVHAAGGVYCRECMYFCGSQVKEDDFCGHGKKKDVCTIGVDVYGSRICPVVVH